MQSSQANLLELSGTTMIKLASVNVQLLIGPHANTPKFMVMKHVAVYQYVLIGQLVLEVRNSTRNSASVNAPTYRKNVLTQVKSSVSHLVNTNAQKSSVHLHTYRIHSPATVSVQLTYPNTATLLKSSIQDCVDASAQKFRGADLHIKGPVNATVQG